ncbi:MAG: hypothetical protein RLZZ450_6824 [Pseudomonadota bacterium]|jgi:hypothetical protein
MSDSTRAPKTFFLNERHELAPTEKASGGRPPQYTPIDWPAKADVLHRSLSLARASVRQSADPLREKHFFLVAAPVPTLTKISKSKNKPGENAAATDYAGKHSRVFARLGVDLLGVSADGHARVHASVDRFERLLATAATLPNQGAREQVRWATIADFSPTPALYRVSETWLRSLV